MLIRKRLTAYDWWHELISGELILRELILWELISRELISRELISKVSTKSLCIPCKRHQLCPWKQFSHPLQRESRQQKTWWLPQWSEHSDKGWRVSLSWMRYVRGLVRRKKRGKWRGKRCVTEIDRERRMCVHTYFKPTKYEVTVAQY